MPPRVLSGLLDAKAHRRDLTSFRARLQVHVHIIPRKAQDFERNDEVYEKLDEFDARPPCALPLSPQPQALGFSMPQLTAALGETSTRSEET